MFTSYFYVLHRSSKVYFLPPRLGVQNWTRRNNFAFSRVYSWTVNNKYKPLNTELTIGKGDRNKTIVWRYLVNYIFFAGWANCFYQAQQLHKELDRQLHRQWIVYCVISLKNCNFAEKAQRGRAEMSTLLLLFVPGAQPA